MSQYLDQLAINTIRTLSMDAVQKAKSGHPGTPMALAPAAYTLWQEILNFDPAHPIWPNRNRFVLSNGHASMLLYSLLHLSKVKAVNSLYEQLGEPSVSLDDMKNFRQLESKCPGHPEYRWTTGVETTTGPLGQGIANSVGMAMAAKWKAAYFNKPGFDMFGYRVYAFCGDGDLMEGVGSEAASMAGHLKLSNLCWIYDNNQITIEGSTNLSFSDDVGLRFEGYGWHVIHVDDANDTKLFRSAIEKCHKVSDRPSLIILDSHIGFGAPNKQDKASAHGEPLGEDEIKLAKRFYGWPEDAHFLVPDGVTAHFENGIGKRGKLVRDAWITLFHEYESAHPKLAHELMQMEKRQLPQGWDQELPEFPADAKGMAGRAASGKVLNAIAKKVPWLVGGSADLAPSTKTLINDATSFSATDFGGRNIHFGIRESAMASIANGLSLSKMRPYGATFLTFSDYARPGIRLSALMEIPVLYIFTHDSIGVGEDGPTHQPIEHLASLRVIPGLVVMRPADANEVTECWRLIMHLAREPVALVLSRQDLPTFDRNQYSSAKGVAHGAYVLADSPDPQVILMSTGSEVSLCLKAFEQLKAEGISARVVSMPSWEIFDRQTQDYKDQVLLPHVKARVAVEQASTMGWLRFAGEKGEVIGMHTFGKSAPLHQLQDHFGFKPERIVDAAKRQMRNY